MVAMQIWCREHDGDCSLGNLSNENGNVGKLDSEITKADCDANRNQSIKVPMFQNGVLRTNCIDCLDRTNVAQYAYGLVALGHQLHALGYMEYPNIDLDNPLAEDLMRIYETMGDTLALQYGGSAAHNKVILMVLGRPTLIWLKYDWTWMWGWNTFFGTASCYLGFFLIWRKKPRIFSHEIMELVGVWLFYFIQFENCSMMGLLLA